MNSIGQCRLPLLLDKESLGKIDCLVAACGSLLVSSCRSCCFSGQNSPPSWCVCVCGVSRHDHDRCQRRRRIDGARADSAPFFEANAIFFSPSSKRRSLSRTQEQAVPRQRENQTCSCCLASLTFWILHVRSSLHTRSRRLCLSIQQGIDKDPTTGSRSCSNKDLSRQSRQQTNHNALTACRAVSFEPPRRPRGAARVPALWLGSYTSCAAAAAGSASASSSRRLLRRTSDAVGPHEGSRT
jgi:hypothetical protein